jgi:hypothetical protein
MSVNVQSLRAERWQQIPGCCIKTTQLLTLLSPLGNFFTKNNMTAVPHPPYFSLFLRINTKLKGCHFDTTEVIEAESQVALNTLTEHDFQDTIKIWQKRWKRCIRVEEDNLEDDGGQ